MTLFSILGGVVDCWDTLRGVPYPLAHGHATEGRQSPLQKLSRMDRTDTYVLQVSPRGRTTETTQATTGRDSSTAVKVPTDTRQGGHVLGPPTGISYPTTVTSTTYLATKVAEVRRAGRGTFETHTPTRVGQATVLSALRPTVT